MAKLNLSYKDELVLELMDLLDPPENVREVVYQKAQQVSISALIKKIEDCKKRAEENHA